MKRVLSECAVESKPSTTKRLRSGLRSNATPSPVETPAVETPPVAAFPPTTSAALSAASDSQASTPATSSPTWQSSASLPISSLSSSSSFSSFAPVHVPSPSKRLPPISEPFPIKSAMKKTVQFGGTPILSSQETREVLPDIDGLIPAGTQSQLVQSGRSGSGGVMSTPHPSWHAIKNAAGLAADLTKRHSGVSQSNLNADELNCPRLVLVALVPPSCDIPSVIPLNMPESQPYILFGRSPRSNVVLNSELSTNAISREHAKIERKITSEGDTEYIIHDLRSMNGVYVNDKRIKDSIKLSTGDIIVFGGPKKIKPGQFFHQPDAEFRYRFDHIVKTSAPTVLDAARQFKDYVELFTLPVAISAPFSYYIAQGIEKYFSIELDDTLSVIVGAVIVIFIILIVHLCKRG